MPSESRVGESDRSAALGSRASTTSRSPADPFAFAAPTEADTTSLRSAGTLSDTHPVQQQQQQAKPQQGDDPFLEMLWKGEQDAERVSRPSAVSSAAPAPVAAATLSAQQPQLPLSSAGSVLSSRPDTPPSVVKSLNFDAAVSTVQLSSVGGGGGTSALDTPLKLSELSAHDGGSGGGSPRPPSRDGSERSSQIPSKSYAARAVPTGLSVATSASTLVESPKTAGMLRKEVPSTAPSAHSSTGSARQQEQQQPSRRSVSPPGPEKPSSVSAALSRTSFASDASAPPKRTPATTRSVSPPAPDNVAAPLRAPSSVAPAASARSVSPPAPDRPASTATAASSLGGGVPVSHASLSSRAGGGGVVVAAASSAKPPAPPVSAASSHASVAALAATQSQHTGRRSVSPPAPARATAPSVASLASEPQLRQQRSQVSSVPSAAAAAQARSQASQHSRRSVSPPGPEKPASAAMATATATSLGRPSATAPTSSSSAAASGVAAHPARSVSPPRPPSSKVAAVPSAAASVASVASFPAAASARSRAASSRRSISPEAPERPQPARQPSSQGSVPVSPAAVRSVSPPRPASSVGAGGGAEVYIPSPMTGLGLEGSRADSFRARLEPHLKSLPSALIRVEGREEELLDSCCAHNGVEVELANAARDAVNSLRAAGGSVAIDPAKTGLLRGLGLDVDTVFSDKECRVVAAALWQLDHPPRETAAFKSVLDGFVARLIAEFSRKQAKKAALEAAAAAQEQEDEQRRRALAPAVVVQQPQQPQVYYGGRSPTRRTIPAPPQCFAQPQVLPPQYLNQAAVATTSPLPPPPQQQQPQPQVLQQQPVAPPAPVNIATAAYCQPAGGGPVPLFQPISPRYASMGERCRAEQLAFIKTRKPMPDTKATYPATRPTQKSVGTGPPETRAVSPTRNGEAGHPGDTKALWQHFGVEQHPYSHAQASYHDPASRRYPTTYDPRLPNNGGGSGGGGGAADGYDPSRPSVSYVTRMPKRMRA